MITACPLKVRGRNPVPEPRDGRWKRHAGWESGTNTKGEIMTLNELIRTAATAYPDATLLEYWDEDHERPVFDDAGDTLACFIVCELASTYEPAASDAVQLCTAIKVIERAVEDLGSVVKALQELAITRMAA